MTTPKPDLMNCPFCGSNNLAYNAERGCVECHNCESEGPDCGDDETEAADLWNTRRAAPAPAPEAEATVGFADDPIRDGPPMDLFKRACDFAKGTFGKDAKIADSAFVHRLASQFSAVADEATKAETERCAKVLSDLGANHMIDERVRTGFNDGAAAIGGSK